MRDLKLSYDYATWFGTIEQPYEISKTTPVFYSLLNGFDVQLFPASENCNKKYVQSKNKLEQTTNPLTAAKPELEQNVTGTDDKPAPDLWTERKQRL